MQKEGDKKKNRGKLLTDSSESQEDQAPQYSPVTNRHQPKHINCRKSSKSKFRNKEQLVYQFKKYYIMNSYISLLDKIPEEPEEEEETVLDLSEHEPKPGPSKMKKKAQI
ncbi:hypothetical protein C0J52_06865 [Blattella germanica]|nr:hypothetical protein C0J52_06865 [Blattella germanica]